MEPKRLSANEIEQIMREQYVFNMKVVIGYGNFRDLSESDQAFCSQYMSEAHCIENLFKLIFGEQSKNSMIRAMNIEVSDWHQAKQDQANNDFRMFLENKTIN